MTERERRAFNRGLETAAQIAKVYAEEYWAMFHHTLLADRLLTKQTTAATLKQDIQRAEELLIDGHGHGSAAHAAQNIGEAIRKAKVKRT